MVLHELELNENINESDEWEEDWAGLNMLNRM